MRTLIYAAAAAFILTAATSPAADKEKTEASELKALQGEWVGAKLFTAEVERSAEDAARFQATFKKKDFLLKWAFKQEQIELNGTVKLKPSAKPAELTGTFQDPVSGGPFKIDCIYEIRDGELVMAFQMYRDGKRPASLEPTKGQDVYVVHFKKKEKEKRR